MSGPEDSAAGPDGSRTEPRDTSETTPEGGSGIREVLGTLRGWTAEGAEAGVATLVDVRRSAPRRPGARFAVSDRGELAGSVSSGCVEGDLHEHIRQVLGGGDARLLHYGITDEMAMEVGLTCGGEIDVLVHRFDPADPVWDALDARVRRKEACALVVGLSEEIRSRTLLLSDDRERIGSLGSGELDREAARRAAPFLDRGGAAVLELGEDGPAVFVEGYLPPARLVVVGATPVARALSAFASRLGYEVTVVDPREAFAREESFPEASRVLRAWPEEGLAELGIDRHTGVVVLAHDRKIDVPALAAALRAGCLYVGQLGGRRTQRTRREALAELGFGEEEIARIHGPVGLDIGAETPTEIALSIAAELVAQRRGAGDAP